MKLELSRRFVLVVSSKFVSICRVLVKMGEPRFLGKYLRVEWLDYVGRFMLNILRICKQLSKVVGALSIPPISVCEFQFIHIFAKNWSGILFNFNLLICVTLTHYGFNFHFPND